MENNYIEETDLLSRGFKDHLQAYFPSSQWGFPYWRAYALCGQLDAVMSFCYLCMDGWLHRKHSIALNQAASATSQVSVRKARVFKTALTALTEPRTLWRRITRFPSPRRWVWLYWTDVVAFRCIWEHLGAHWITVEQSGKYIFFGNAAGVARNHSYYLSFNDFQNLCIQFVFASLYLWIYIATYLHTVYLDWQHAVIECSSRCAWRWQSRELIDTLWGCDRGGLDEDLEVFDLQAVDGRRARCWDSIHLFVNSKPWESDKVTLPLKLLWRTGWWQSICREICQKLKLHSGANLKSREWRDDRQS